MRWVGVCDGWAVICGLSDRARLKWRVCCEVEDGRGRGGGYFVVELNVLLVCGLFSLSCSPPATLPRHP